MNPALALAGAILVATAVLHSVRGEQRLIGVLLGSTTSPVARRALRYNWHMGGLMMAVTGATIAWPGTPRLLVMLVAVAYLVLGGVSLWLTRGRHISGPAFMGAALLALAGVLA